MKATKRTSTSQKLLREIQVARFRLARVECQLASAKEQARIAKRRRKEAKQALRRARKQVKLAKRGVSEAKLLLSDAQAKLAQSGVRLAARKSNRIKGKRLAKQPVAATKAVARVRKARKQITAPLPTLTAEMQLTPTWVRENAAPVEAGIGKADDSAVEPALMAQAVAAAAQTHFLPQTLTEQER